MTSRGRSPAFRGSPVGGGAIRGVFRRETLGKDALAGTILGIESVPDGLAIGLLAGVNPVAGIYAFLFGMAGAALATSSTFMAVQATSAMALIVSDTDLSTQPDPDRALFTLAMLTGVIMIVAGVLGAGRMLRFVPTAVMVGFVTAVGVNIVLGQLANLTGYVGVGPNRLFKAVDTFANVWSFDLPTLVVGLVTIALIVVLTRTPLRSLGLVVAIAVGSALAALFTFAFGWEVLTVGDVADVPSGLPAPVLPSLGDLGYLALPALSLAFVGLVQGAGVAAGVPNADGKPADAYRNFIGQGVGSIVAGVFRGMPVGGSMSGSALIVAAGARTRLALFIAATVMALLILVASGVVSFVAMPALAGLLIVVGVQAIKPARIQSVAKTGPLQTTVMGVTFVLTLLIPLQFAVLVGVGLAVILFVAQQSNRIRVRRLEFHADGRLREVDPMAVRAAARRRRAAALRQPGVRDGPGLRGAAAEGGRRLARVGRHRAAPRDRRARPVLVAVLDRYLDDLEQHDSTLWLVVAGERLADQLAAGGLLERLGPDRVYESSEWIGEAVHRAHRDAWEWVRERE